MPSSTSFQASSNLSNSFLAWTKLPDVTAVFVLETTANKPALLTVDFCPGTFFVELEVRLKLLTNY
jgi:hypothetical protein